MCRQQESNRAIVKISDSRNIEVYDMDGAKEGTCSRTAMVFNNLYGVEHLNGQLES
jgi:hypothetical protein